MADISFPYPVLLNESGDIVGDFKVDVNYDPSIAGFYTLEFAFALNNEYFEKLIADNRAAYTVEIECNATNYRNTFSTTDSNMNIRLSDGDVRDLVNVRIFICATCDIPDYKPTGMNAELYGIDPFDIQSGEVIGLHPETSFVADRKFDSLNEPVKSFVRLKESNRATEEMWVNYGDEFIEIELPKEDYALYQEVRTHSPELVHSSIVFPVLVDALHELQKDENAGLTWYDKLKQICRDRAIKYEEDPLVAAQKLLGLPVKRTFGWRKKDLDK